MASGELERAIERLRTERPDDLDVLFASTQFFDLKKRFEKNLIGSADYEVQKAKIILNLTDLCENI